MTADTEAQQDGFEEVVLVFDAEGQSIETEMRSSDFDMLVSGSQALEQFAASVVKAAFAVAGTAMSLRSVVFFVFKVDEDGVLDAAFNLPLRYLADNAGPGPDLGAGPIRLACRGKCSVPWHSVNLWEPVMDPESGSIQQVQKVLWRNRLGLRPTGALARIGDGLQLNEHHTEAPELEPRKDLEAQLTRTFGEEGKLNVEKLVRQQNERVTQVSDKYRTEMHEQQQGYLDQIRTFREEIQELKAALRHEQQRSRRLQELLRGEP